MIKKALHIALLIVLWCVPAHAQMTNQTFPDGSPHVTFTQSPDKRTVVRTEFYPNGRINNVGTFIDEKLTGLYKKFFENGQKYIEIEYDQGIENGFFKEYYSNGVLKSDGEYINGRINGRQNIYFENGILSQVATYDNDVLNGETRIYFPGGQIRQISNYKNGKLHGSFRIYHENGTLLSYRNYADDRQQGPFFTYYDNGILQESGIFENDQIVSLLSYNINGILVRVVNFVGGIKQGEYYEFYDNGVIKKRAFYEYDNEISAQYYDASGESLNHTTLDTSPDNQAFGSFSTDEIIIFGCALLFAILGTAMVVSGYYRVRRPKPVLTQDAIISDGTASAEGSESESDQMERDLIDPAGHKMYRSVVETVVSGIYVTDASGVLIYGNNTFAQLLGYKTKPETVGLNLDEIFSAAAKDRQNFLQSLKRSNSIKDFIFELRKSDGSISTLSTSANQIFNDRGDIIGIQGVVMDITEKSQLEDAVLAEKKKLELLMNFFETIDTIREMSKLTEYVIQEISEILESDRCSLMITDETTNSLKVCESKGIADDIKAQTSIGWGEPIAGKVAKEGRPILIRNIEYDEEFKGHTKPGYQGRSLIAAPLINNDKVVGVLCVTDKRKEIKFGEPYSSIDLKLLIAIASKVVIALENVQIYKDLNLLSHTDPITQIYNYRLFNQSLDQQIARFNRDKKPLAIFMMDLDSFKSYNDEYGHVEGDELLKNLGKILKDKLRETDIVCRYAGDEFCVVLPDTDVEGARLAAEKVVTGVRKFPHFKRTVTISIGIAPYESGLDKKDFIKRADSALYEAKHSGKNTVRIYQYPKDSTTS